MVVAQSSALLLWDVALLGLSFVARTVSPAHGLASIVRLRSDVGLFVELLVFGAIAAAVPCVVLLRTLFPHGEAGKSVVSSPTKSQASTSSTCIHPERVPLAFRSIVQQGGRVSAAAHAGRCGQEHRVEDSCKLYVCLYASVKREGSVNRPYSISSQHLFEKPYIRQSLALSCSCVCRGT